MTPEGTFRILTASASSTVADAVRLAKTSPEVTDLYGRLLMGASLLQLAQSPFDRLQCRLEHNGTAGNLLADVWPGPIVRGRVESAAGEVGSALGDSGLVTVSRQPARGGELYESVVPLRRGSVADALQQYCLESEQVLTLFSLVTVLTPDGDVEAGAGMIVQALPGMTREHLAAVTACLEKASFSDLVEAGDDPIGATEAIFHSLSLHHVGGDPIRYQCRCSQEAAVRAVAMLSPEELAEVHDGRVETVTCEFCGTVYTVAGQDLPTS